MGPAMPAKEPSVPDDLQHLFPLTPAVFFILFALAQGEKHGYAIMQHVSVLSDGKFRMGPGTLYTTIQRLLELSLIEEIDADSGNRRRVLFSGFRQYHRPERPLVMQQPDPVHRSDCTQRPGSHRVVGSQLDRVAEEAEVICRLSRTFGRLSL